ncbi:class I SAM-dependent methyltransferase [Rhodococcus opacus]|uniref:class I SAM-dependent methyltransferase n=1 Tax=Rhodococcus opacus TaxID=37919 RepID=UPI00146ACF4F
MDDVIMPTMHTIFDRISEGTPVPDSVEVTGHGEAAGFHVDRIQALQPHNARTLDDRVQALRPHHDEAVSIASEEVYQRYITHLTGSAAHIGSGHIDAIPLTPGQDGIGSVCPGE